MSLADESRSYATACAAYNRNNNLSSIRPIPNENRFTVLTRYRRNSKRRTRPHSRPVGRSQNTKAFMRNWRKYHQTTLRSGRSKKQSKRCRSSSRRD